MEPTREQWTELYQAAIRLKKQKPWQWMSMGQIFAITDPADGVNYYCSVQSEDDLDYVQILIGEDGLNRIMSLVESISQGAEYDDDEAADASNGLASYMLNFDEHSLNCFFTDQEHLSQYEAEVLQNLELSFRGSKQWISFRHIQPGQLTESVHDAEQVRILTTVLEQVYSVCALEKKQRFIRDLFHDTTTTEVFRWFYAPQAKIWQGTFLALESIMNKGTPIICSNQLDLLKIRRLKGSRRIYEFIRMYMPMPVEHHGRLFFPLTFLLVDMDNGMIVWNHIDTGDEGYELRLIKKLSDFFLKEGYKPSRILTADYVLYQIASDFCDKSKIFLEFLNYTITGDEILESFQESTRLTYEAMEPTIMEMDKEKHLLSHMTRDDSEPPIQQPSQQAKIIDFRTGRPVEQ